ncbi:hypothetical protein IWQ62_004236 [Dispira parvispora]|uniref:Uncharacterized protein n=1 Tax=Dispira parvispora TaxID=1520584 RepID=A0A9W8AS91_9FUNG|nr:hypothetical protein IWQ62_004236 [Dispira parvispora]
MRTPSTSITSRHALYHTEDQENHSEPDESVVAAFEKRMQELLSVDQNEDTSPNNETESPEPADDNGAVFRLFATSQCVAVRTESDDKVSSVPRQPVTVTLEESADRLAQMRDIALDYDTILAQARIPWERQFYPNRVIVNPPTRPLSKAMKTRRRLRKQLRKQGKRPSNRSTLLNKPKGPSPAIRRRSRQTR